VLVARGVDAGQVFHCATGSACRFPGNDRPVSGPHPDRSSYGSFLTFRDPDGNSWLLQEVSTRLPGRVDGDATYASAHDLSQALQRAAAAKGQHGVQAHQPDQEWADALAEYLVREQSGG